MPKLTPPQLILLGALLGSLAYYYANKAFNDYMDLVTYQVQQNTMLAIKGQCDAGIKSGMRARLPIRLGDNYGYWCYPIGEQR